MTPLEEPGGHAETDGALEGVPMGDHETERETTRSGTDLGATTAALAAVAVLAIAASVGSAVPAAGTVIAMAVLVGSLSLLSAESLATRAVGSCGVVGALAALVVSLSLAVARADLILVVGTIAVGATAISLCVRADRRAVASQSLGDSLIGAAIVGIALTVVSYGAVGATIRAARAILEFLTASPFGAFVSVVILGLATLVVCDLAEPTLEPWLPEGVDIPPIVDAFVRLLEWPKEAGYVLCAVGVAVYLTGASGAFAGALAALGPVGTVVEWTLRSGVLHGSVAVIALVAVGAVVGSGLSSVARTWLGSYPLRTLALASGGGLWAVLVVPAMVLSSRLPAPESVFGLLGVLFVAFVFVTAGTAAIRFARWGDDTVRRRGLILGSGALFVTTLLGAADGLEALVVFAGVAASILVWDLGENAITIRRQLGERVDSRESELVHATGSAFVGIVGVVLATTAMYVLGNVSPPAERWQALAPLALALLALVVFVLLTTSWNEDAVRSLSGSMTRGDLRRLPTSYPLTFTLASLAVAAAVLIGLGFGDVVFFIAIVAFPFVLLALISGSSDPRPNNW